MNTFDQQKAARVWQRVQGEMPKERKPEPLEDLQELILNEWNAASTYQALARQASPQGAAVLQRLAREEHGHGACLRGMYSLVTGEKCELRMPKLPKEPVERTLRRCYGLEMRSLKAYEAKTDHPEYGHVFARIAQQEREHCMALLELLGQMDRGGPGAK